MDLKHIIKRLILNIKKEPFPFIMSILIRKITNTILVDSIKTNFKILQDKFNECYIIENCAIYNKGGAIDFNRREFL